MKLELKDGTIIEKEIGITGLELANSLSKSLAKEAIALKVNGELKDLSLPLENDAKVEIITKNDSEALDILNHSTAHLLAHAVMELYPDSQLAFGPSIEEGFYYDIMFKEPISENDFPKIEKKMHELANKAIKIERVLLTKDEAKQMFKDQKFKLDHLNDIEDPITAYKQDNFADLCRGPHVKHTGLIKHFKLLSLAGAYYKGDQKNEQLTRIYGTSFFSEEDLKKHLQDLEDRKLSDHRRLGKELGLFMLSDYGPGFPFFLPNGMILRRELENFWYDICEKRGYVFVKTPIILSRELWETSGHWANYKDNMYTTKIDDKDYAIKPMNCPGGMLVYANSIHSYRDLPLRVGELGLVHRHEKSGQLHGLMRVRCFTQDDAHIFMTPEQVRDEIKGVVKLINEVYSLFGFKYHVELSTRPEDSMGSDEDWDMATEALRGALDDLGLPYVVNEGDGAFYGPKIDFHLEDSIGRTWQCGTIQLDFQLPLRFNLEYTGADGEKHRPIMIHRVIFGSIERFIGILIEHFAGAFPTWLAPVQVKVLPISDKYMDYAQKVLDELNNSGVRAEIDTRAEKIGYKIREAQMKKIPYMLVVGAKEEEDGLVSIRSRFEGDEGQKSLTDFLAAIKMEIQAKTAREVKKEDDK